MRNDVVGRHRLREQLQIERCHHVREPDRSIGVIAGIGVDAQLEFQSDRLAHRLDAVTVGLDVAADRSMLPSPTAPPEAVTRTTALFWIDFERYAFLYSPTSGTATPNTSTRSIFRFM